MQDIREIEFIISNNWYFLFSQVIKNISFKRNFYKLYQIVKNDSFKLKSDLRKIKKDFENVLRILIVLNAWFNSQKIIYLKILIY